MKYSSYYTYQKYCNIGGQGMIPVYPNVYSIDADETLQKRLHKANNSCCTDLPAIYRTTSGSPYCDSSYNKCVDIYTEISYDNGETWEFYSSGTSIVEYDSEYCRAFRWVDMDINTDYWCDGCSGTPIEFKVRGYTLESTSPCDASGVVTYSTECDSIYVLNSTDFPTDAVGVEIGDCVTSISGDAFYDKTSINSVYVPKSVTSIPDNCFSGKTSLVSVTLPETITSIGEKAFYGCIQLYYLDLWDSITSIGVQAFYNCDSLTSIHIPSGVTSIPSFCFDNCGALTVVDIPSNVTTIGYGAFRNCGNLYNITIGSGVTSIGDYAFQGCTSLTDVPVESMTIGEGTYYGCTSLSSLTISSGVTSIGSNAFFGCTGLTGITVEATTPPTLGSGAFGNTNYCLIYVPIGLYETYKTAWPEYANRITTVEYGNTAIEANVVSLPRSACTMVASGTSYISAMKLDGIRIDVTTCYRFATTATHHFEYFLNASTIGDLMFASTDISTCTIPWHITTIGEEAFKYCYSLESITIPSGVTSIGDDAFFGCRHLTSVTVLATTPPTLEGYGSALEDTNYCPIYVPAASLSAYQSAWSRYSSRIQAIPT